MNRLASALLAGVAMLLAACGTAAPPAPTRSSVEERQTALALEGRPTLPPLPAGPTLTPRPSAPDAVALLQLTDDDPRALGRPDAPVLIIEFTDYE